MGATQSRGLKIVVSASIAVTVALGVAHLNFPFMGDQALFAVYSRMLDGGAVLYEDVWDVKQPGIFAFYWIGGRLFGFTEFGVHLLELIYLLVFGVVLTRLLRDRYRSEWIAGLIPAIVVGWYYAVTQLDYLTQVESLAGPLIFGSAWFLARGGTARSILAGVLGGFTLYFKLALGPLLVAVWLMTLHQSGGVRRRAPQALIPVIGGLVIAAVPVVVYVAANGLGDRVWWTFITYPPQILAIAGRTPERLIRAVGQFGLLFLPMIPLALWGLRVRRTDPMARIGAVWIGVGFVTYLLQLWWGYILLINLVPLALLALDGLDDLLANRRPGYRWQMAALLVASLPAALTLGDKLLALGQNGLGIGDDRLDYQASVSADYATIRNDIGHLDELGADSIYVLGDPLYLYLSERDQRLAITGWSPGFWTAELWDELTEGIITQQPLLILIDEFSAEIAYERSPETLAIIESEYDVLRPSHRSGTWYVYPSSASP